jgi:hypothetical protein
MPHLNYLILNESTLFYFDLSASKTRQTGIIQDWTAQVAKANKNLKSKVSAPGTATSSTVVRTTTSSSVVVSQAAATALTTKKKAKLEPKAVSKVSAFLDEDESAERDAALTSPIKGKKRLTSKVC